MAIDITIKNMPPNLYKKLKARADAHRRSVNSEAISCLEKVLNLQHADQNLQDNPDQTEELLSKIKDLHKRVPPI
ncbi:MAG: Arc family DNA-binding protein, partial [Gemmatimonadota bacterium]|nr:Arc family DNA-binding protein [Gemmatimonadota bacterium]